MAFIHYVEDSEAPPELKATYDRLRQRSGHVANILRIHGLNPPSLDAHFAYYKTVVLGRSPLSRAQREMIAVVVSSINECHY